MAAQQLITFIYTDEEKTDVAETKSHEVIKQLDTISEKSITKGTIPEMKQEGEQ